MYGERKPNNGTKNIYDELSDTIMFLEVRINTYKLLEVIISIAIMKISVIMMHTTIIAVNPLEDVFIGLITGFNKSLLFYLAYPLPWTWVVRFTIAFKI